jgi:hypothetical protein
MMHGPHYTRQAETRETAFLRQRIGATSKRLSDQSEISDRLKVISTVILIVLCLYLGLTQFSPWNLPMTLRHLAAGGGCDIAHAVHLAPAYRGQPGYWSYLDPLHKGIACSEGKAHAI